jgi:hypothetical protein
VLKQRKKKPVPVPGDSDRIMGGHRHEEELKGMDREMMDEKIYGSPDRGGRSSERCPEREAGKVKSGREPESL